MKKKDLLAMPLHSIEFIDDQNLNIQRVFNGWNYIYLEGTWNKQEGYEYNRIVQVVFVPEKI